MGSITLPCVQAPHASDKFFCINFRSVDAVGILLSALRMALRMELRIELRMGVPTERLLSYKGLVHYALRPFVGGEPLGVGYDFRIGAF